MVCRSKLVEIKVYSWPGDMRRAFAAYDEMRTWMTVKYLDAVEGKSAGKMPFAPLDAVYCMGAYTIFRFNFSHDVEAAKAFDAEFDQRWVSKDAG